MTKYRSLLVVILLMGIAVLSGNPLVTWPGQAASATAARLPSSAATPSPAPQGMVWIPGGEFWMGSDEPNFRDALPWHRVYVDGFWMDKTEVTNEEFTRFVTATGYVTVAEHAPRAEDYPGAPPE